MKEDGEGAIYVAFEKYTLGAVILPNLNTLKGESRQFRMAEG